MKNEKSPLEKKLLNMLKELEKDIKFVKNKSDALSHKNKMALKSKVKIIQNVLDIFRAKRNNKIYKKHYYPLTTENIKYAKKIDLIVNEENK